MSEYIIRGGHPASGTVRVEGAKNAVLPILSACLLVHGVSVLDNVPRIKDVEVTIEILRSLGCHVSMIDCGDSARVIVDASNVISEKIPERLAGCLRSSIVFMGALLGRVGVARGSLPGGCRLGDRPIDMHLKAFEELGYELEQVTEWDICIRRVSDGCGDASVCSCRCVTLPFPSVGATENIMMAALGINGTTVIKNAAREPEIVDLQTFLNKVGYSVCGAGSSCITVKTRDALRREFIGDFQRRVCHRIIPDRIVAATYMCVAAVTGGYVTVDNIEPSHVQPMIKLLRSCGCSLRVMQDSIYVERTRGLIVPKYLLETRPYPGFPTDMQPLATVVLALACGSSMIRENIFSNRFSFVPQLNRFGADIIINNNTAMICGVAGVGLNGCSCVAEDLRGGAALVLAALAADGKSRVAGIEYVERGYECLDAKLRGLGLDVERDVE